MQSLVRRTLLAQKQAVRRAKKVSNKKGKQKITNALEQQRFHLRNEVEQIRKARQAMKEDWELGPLAPKRDVGFDKEGYGTIDTNRAEGPELTKRDAQAQMPFLRGIHIGDRVVVVAGREKGKIGFLMERNNGKAEAKVEGVNMVDIKMPEWMLVNQPEEDRNLIRTMEKPIPYSHLRLCITLRDEKTGVVTNHAAEKVHKVGGEGRWVFAPDGSKIMLGRWETKPDGTKLYKPWKPKSERIQPNRSGLGKELDRMTPAERRAAKEEDKKGDTLRLYVEEKTFMPTLLTPPMPGSVIDELRNKYSVFRTRHDPEYIEAKMKEDEEAEAQKALNKKMRTPLGEINRLERKLRKAKGKGKLTDQMLERIGAVIASKKQLYLGEGVEKEVAV